MADANTPVTTTVTVAFADPSAAAGNAHLSAEVDGRFDGLNGGKTSFTLSDVAYILVYSSPGVKVDVKLSGGSAVVAGTQTVEKTDKLTFTNSNTGRLSKPVKSITKTTWIVGANLGNASLDTTDPGKTNIKVTSSSGIGIAEITYTATATAYKITPPSPASGSKEVEVSILVIGS